MIWIDLNLIVQVLLVAMHLNMKLAYDKCDENLPFDEWIQRQEGASDMFYFWNLIMRFQEINLDLYNITTHTKFYI